MKTLFFVLGILCPALHLHAQPLTIGDTLHWQPAVVYSKGQPRAFTGKDQPLLLVFINPTCGSCDQQLRYLDSIGSSLPASLQIIAVTRYTYPELQNKLLTPALLRSPHLSFLTADTLLRKRFPYYLVPHLVWIGHSGRVAAITGAKEVTPAALNELTDRKTINLPLKKDFINFQREQPFATQEELLLLQPPLISSSLLPYAEGLADGVGRHFLYNNSVRRIYLINVTRKELYYYATPSSERNFDLKLRDTLAFNPPPDNNRYRYCYELMVPATTDQPTIRRLMLEDFDRLFNYQRKEKTVKTNGRLITSTILTDRP
ncbi:MAG: hypothetical protein ABS85_15375 [Sphingobacteriales bacterium SCN 48-20]|uniref:hypothetical protein n=1 Tax=Terrimonas ferruginea TaxID=249 RepID=UPI00086953CC|nr:hypothetical protein [Terrimonas ferruginea]MBN8784951.1 hypothetical protein [Terrimonas ferruginea]ODT90424.1 MAG: hypothetical protein ABS85_15375 [Sphingobacteriales bacterium SCN 48-20]OJW44405.1 MAG: hypothetical protein BGO56_07050 [Sphingobacteriales bacterium 48-107]